MRKLTLALAATTMALPVAMPAPVMAHQQSGYYQGRTWVGADGRTYCRRGNGTTGLIVGGAAGAFAGRAIDTRGSRATGTILGAAAGALIGRELQRAHKQRRTCR
jgi:uncharacterized protein YcfJ